MAHLEKKVELKRKQFPWGAILKKWCHFAGWSRFFLNNHVLESGTKMGPLKDLFYRRSNSAPREPFWCQLFF